ncbi:SagB family peptide dehydrogenase [Haloarchaeobius sp. TZWWS8]|uniref:SagB family peptide dehydrogenase n=1 Tax=Haloarchaeobius sp. TZWWS8 TaxID=3446121 RepID=UPI003EBD5DBE
MVDARDYHERSKHSPKSVRETDWSLDLDNRPRPSKVYVDLPRVSLGSSLRPPDESALSVLATGTAEPTDGDGGKGDDMELTTLCHYAAGVTKTLEIRGESAQFRAASCTGKLYHVDLYAVTGELDDAPAGVYHYDPESDEFDVLRKGDFRGVLAGAGGYPAVEAAPVTIVATSTWWRNAWKYRERTYRHAFWDSGTVLANLLAVAHGLGHRAEVVTGFGDGPVVDLLGLDPTAEAPLELVAIGSGDSSPDPPAVEPISPDVDLGSDPVDYPLIHDAWKQSTLPDGDAATDWRERFAGVATGAVGRHGPGDGDRIALDPVDAETASARPVGNTIERRGSLREYSHEAMSRRKVGTILDRALGPVPVDCLGGDGPDSLLDYYVFAHAVEDVPAGAYQFHPGDATLEAIGDVDRRTAAHLALGQEVVGDAAVNVYAMADVDAIVERFGNRGYRVAQLEGGIALGRLYLATYAHRGIGGRGFTFYDDLVTEQLSPRAANQTPMTLFAFGKPDK